MLFGWQPERRCRGSTANQSRCTAGYCVSFDMLPHNNQDNTVQQGGILPTYANKMTATTPQRYLLTNSACTSSSPLSSKHQCEQTACLLS
jgi:hypothetical protein